MLDKNNPPTSENDDNLNKDTQDSDQVIDDNSPEIDLLTTHIQNLTKPSEVSYKDETSDKTFANIVISPLEKGYGITLGNALRRVLLSSLRGSAIVAIKIAGVDHEFSTLSGMRPDVSDLIIGLKALKLKIHNQKPAVVSLKKVGPCVVTAADIESDSNVEFLDPKQVICRLSNKQELDMKLYCDMGKGYASSVQIKKQNNFPVGVIPIDALFSPVTKVAFKINDTRVGNVTNYDKLLMSVETDGSITPNVALNFAARILQNQLQLFVKFEEKIEEDDKQQDADLGFNPVLLKKVNHLELSVRSQNCLQNANIVYIGDLVIRSESEMLKTQNFGRKSLHEIRAILAKYHLKFGMNIPEWPPNNVEELARKYEDQY